MKENQKRDPDEAMRAVSGARSSRSQGRGCPKASLLQRLNHTSVEKTQGWKWPDLLLPLLMAHVTP